MLNIGGKNYLENYQYSRKVKTCTWKDERYTDVESLREDGEAKLDELSKLALPEPWRFKKPIYKTKNEDTPILERYIHIIFRKQSIDFNSEGMPGKRRVIFMWRMRVPVSIQDYTHPDTKGFMPALTGTTKGLQ